MRPASRIIVPIKGNGRTVPNPERGKKNIYIYIYIKENAQRIEVINKWTSIREAVCCLLGGFAFFELNTEYSAVPCVSSTNY